MENSKEYNYMKGDLLESNAQALVNTVNLDGVMGKGIALQFKNRFPENFKKYKKACEDGTIGIGRILVTEETTSDGGKKLIINFPTKTTWRKPSEYTYIEQGLNDLVKIIEKYDIKSIAVPALGCNNGKLDWAKVKPMIEEKLQPLDIKTDIYEPHDGISIKISEKNKKTAEGNAYTFYSGGAEGADREWERMIKDIPGADITVYRPQDIEKLTQEDAERVEREYREVIEELKRPYYGADTYTGRLMRRDMLQVREADAVFAIARLARNGYVDGGTGYSTTRAILNGTPVWLFDQPNGKWMRWDNQEMRFKEEIPEALTPRACLVGSRDLKENGRTAMQRIIKRTTDMAEKENQKENQQENIMRRQSLSENGWIAEGQHYSIEEGRWKTETNLQNDIRYHDIQEVLEPKVTDVNRILMQDWNVDALRLTLKEEDGSVNATIVYTLKDLPSEALEECDIVIDCEKRSMNILTGRALNLAADIERERNRAMTPEQKRISRQQARREKYINTLISEDNRSLSRRFREPLTAVTDGRPTDRQYENLNELLNEIQVMRDIKESAETKTTELKNAKGGTEYTILYTSDTNRESDIVRYRPDFTVSTDSHLITAYSDKAKALVIQNNEMRIMDGIATSTYTTYKQKDDERYTMDRMFRFMSPSTGREGWYADKFIRANGIGEDVMTDINDFLSQENSEYNREQFLKKEGMKAVLETVYPAGETQQESARLAREGNEIIRIAHCLTDEFNSDYKGKADIVINAETGQKRVLTVKGEKFIIERAENPVMKNEMEFIRDILPLGQTTLKQKKEEIQTETNEENKKSKSKETATTPSEEGTDVQKPQEKKDTVQCTGTTKDGRTVTFTLRPNQAKLLSITGVGSEYLQNVEKMSRDGITLNREYTITTDRGEIRIADLKSYRIEQTAEETKKAKNEQKKETPDKKEEKQTTEIYEEKAKEQITEEKNKISCSAKTKDGKEIEFSMTKEEIDNIKELIKTKYPWLSPFNNVGIPTSKIPNINITTEQGKINIKDLTDIKFYNTKNTINGETQIINQQNSTTMAEKESAAKAAEQENAQKEIYGSVYKNDEFTNKNGETVALAIPYYQITLDMDKIKGMEPGKDGNIYLSIKERKNAGDLAKENKPTCFITENTYFKDKRVDLYSKCDIVIKKADLEKIQKNDGYGEKAYILVGSNGDVVPMKSKYEGEAVEIEGRAYHVDPVERQITLAKRIDSKFDISKAVGNAWLIPGKEGKADFYNIAMQSDKIKMLPIDEKNKLHFAIHELKERMNDKAPTHIIVPEHEFATGKIDIYSVKDFEVAKVSLTDQRVIKNEEITVENKTYKRNVTYLQVTSDNKVMLNYSKYPELCEKRKDGSTKHNFTLYGAEARDVDIEARKAEIERRKELAAKKEGETQEKTAAQEKKEEPTVKKEAKKTVKAKKSKGMGV